MAVVLHRQYLNYLAGTIVNLPTSVEQALITQNLAAAAVVANTTTGAVASNATTGIAAIAAGASSVVITNSLVDASTPVWAVVSQAAADGTLLRVERILTAAGSFTIYGTANATATTLIKWAIINPVGLTELN